MTEELREKIKGLPGSAGAYIFKDSQESIIYVGKAKNIKKRIKNHFQKPDQHAYDFTGQIAEIDFIETAGEKEALLLEQKLIKKYQPKWNVEWKDDKNYFYIALTNENFPRFYLTHQPASVEVRLPQMCGSLTSKNCSPRHFGPFVNGREVKSFLLEIRKLLPYRTCAKLPKKPCLYADLGLCPGLCVWPRSKKRYLNILQTLRSLLELYQGKNLRIECYDISNLSGTLSVGSMVVSVGGKADKSQYRKFKIKTVDGQNDVASLAEILQRRLRHQEWPKPDLIVLDGGKGQLKAARRIDIPVVALAKTGGGRLYSPFSGNYVSIAKLPQNVANHLLRVRDEAHRFAITYNRQKRLNIIKETTKK